MNNPTQPHLRTSLLNSLVLLCTILLLLPHAVSASECGKSEGGQLRLQVLTVNLLFSEIETRDERLERIAAFIADPDGDGNPDDPVDVVLLQESVEGALVGTESSALDLKNILRQGSGLEYELRTAFQVGVPGLLSVANATLSLCDIRLKLVKRFSRASEIEFNGRVIKLPRNVLMTRLEIPGNGRLNVYNTHLCSRCGILEKGERAQQVGELLEFVNNVEGYFAPFSVNPIIMGGDFNIISFKDNNDPPDPNNNPQDNIDAYKEILRSGFIDLYALQNGDAESLCNPNNNTISDFPDEHCTVDVTELGDNNPARIDYFFGGQLGNEPVADARVVFNTAVDSSQPTVSDHAGLFMTLKLPR